MIDKTDILNIQGLANFVSRSVYRDFKKLELDFENEIKALQTQRKLMEHNTPANTTPEELVLMMENMRGEEKGLNIALHEIRKRLWTMVTKVQE